MRYYTHLAAFWITAPLHSLLCLPSAVACAPRMQVQRRCPAAPALPVQPWFGLRLPAAPRLPCRTFAVTLVPCVPVLLPRAAFRMILGSAALVATYLTPACRLAGSYTLVPLRFHAVLCPWILTRLQSCCTCCRTDCTTALPCLGFAVTGCRRLVRLATGYTCPCRGYWLLLDYLTFTLRFWCPFLLGWVWIAPPCLRLPHIPFDCWFCLVILPVPLRYAHTALLPVCCLTRAQLPLLVILALPLYAAHPARFLPCGSAFACPPPCYTAPYLLRFGLYIHSPYCPPRPLYPCCTYCVLTLCLVLAYPHALLLAPLVPLHTCLLGCLACCGFPHCLHCLAHT